MADSSDDDSSDDEVSIPEITRDSLPADTLALLQSHLAQRESVAATAGGRDSIRSLAGEDFGLSQFWYDDATQKALAEELLLTAMAGRVAGGEGKEEVKKIAIVSAPTVMHGIELLVEDGIYPKQHLDGVYIFEYDPRFGDSYPSRFVQYDFNEPLKVPEHLHGLFDYVMVDPPYLNHDCIREFFKTINLLAKHPRQQQPIATIAVLDEAQQHQQEEEKTVVEGEKSEPSEGNSGGKDDHNDAKLVTPVMFITSPLNHKMLKKEYGLGRTPFTLKFSSKFATPMSCYTNYPSERLGAWCEDDDDDDDDDDEDDDDEGAT